MKLAELSTIVALALALSSQAYASQPTSNAVDFVKSCRYAMNDGGGKDQEKQVDAALCVGLVSGVVQTVSAIGKYENGPLQICVKGQKPIADVIARVAAVDETSDLITSLASDPDGKMAPTVIALLAMAQVHPCLP